MFPPMRKSLVLQHIPLSSYSLLNINKFFSEFYLICKNGTKETYKDFKFFCSHYNNTNHETLSFLEARTMRIISHDALKIIPFAFFIIVPLSGIFLAPYLFFFPNAIPHRYLKYFLKERNKQFLEDKRKKALRNIREMGLNISDFNMNSENLIILADFLRMEYVSFTFIPSQLLNFFLKCPVLLINALFWCLGSERRLEMKHWIFEYRMKMNFFPLENIRKKIILFQIKRHLKKIMKEDHKLMAISEKSLEKMESNELMNYLEERGFKINEEIDILDGIIKWRKRIMDGGIDYKNQKGYIKLLEGNYREIS